VEDEYMYLGDELAPPGAAVYTGRLMRTPGR